jgi:hypothetical protein
MSTSIQDKDARFSGFNATPSHLSRPEHSEVVELKQHGYDYCYLNLLSIFGDKLPLERIRMLAAECTRMRLRQGSEFYTFLSNLPALIELQSENGEAGSETIPVSLYGWNFELLRSVLGKGKGLILCSHHFGLYRNIIVEMALLGFKIWSFIDKASYDQTIAGFMAVNRSLNGRTGSTRVEGAVAETDLPINLLCVDDPSFARKVARALRRGEIVLVFIDGNTGWDGPWGNKSKTVIDFLGFPIAVKNGAARLAATLDAPLLSILTPRTSDNSGQVVLGEPLIPPSRLTGAAREDFVHEAMQSLYGHLAKAILERPEQWESSRSFHRWRVPSPAEPDSNSLEAEQREVTRLLGIGATFSIDEKRFAHLESQDGGVWIDVKRLKIYKHGERVEKVLQILAQQNGINQSWIDHQGRKLDGENNIVPTLGYLKKLNQIVASSDELSI